MVISSIHIIMNNKQFAVTLQAEEIR